MMYYELRSKLRLVFITYDLWNQLIIFQWIHKHSSTGLIPTLVSISDCPYNHILIITFNRTSKHLCFLILSNDMTIINTDLTILIELLSVEYHNLSLEPYLVFLSVSISTAYHYFGTVLTSTHIDRTTKVIIRMVWVNSVFMDISTLSIQIDSDLTHILFTVVMWYRLYWLQWSIIGNSNYDILFTISIYIIIH